MTAHWTDDENSAVTSYSAKLHCWNTNRKWISRYNFGDCKYIFFDSYLRNLMILQYRLKIVNFDTALKIKWEKYFKYCYRSLTFAVPSGIRGLFTILTALSYRVIKTLLRDAQSQMRYSSPSGDFGELSVSSDPPRLTDSCLLKGKTWNERQPTGWPKLIWQWF